MSRRVSTRRQLGGRVLAEKGLRAPDSPFDARAGVEMEFLTFGQFFNGDAFTIGDFVDRIRGKVGALKK